MKNKGFTLVELLVVIAIVIIISTVGMVSFSATSKKSRDSRRMADLEKIRLSLEMVRQIGSTYPATATVQTILVPSYLQSWPSDPKANSYVYNRVTNYSYTLDATMEDLGSTNMAGNIYRVTNL